MKFSVLLSLILLLLAQVPAGPLSQRTARKQLKHMGLAFTIDSFLDTVAEGEPQTCEMFLDAGMSPDVTYKGDRDTGRHITIRDGDTPLTVAVKRNDPRIVSLLLTRCADVNLPANDFNSPFADATPVRESQVPWFSQTALMIAAGRGNLEEMDLLLGQGADPNATDESGRTVIELAAASYQRDAMRFLVMRGADVRSYSERTIRMITAEPDLNDEVTRLINGLYLRRSENRWTGPSLEEQDRIPERILEIAAPSPAMRSWVIEKMSDVLEDLVAREEPIFALAWMTAADVLGKLRATEAISIAYFPCSAGAVRRNWSSSSAYFALRSAISSSVAVSSLRA